VLTHAEGTVIEPERRPAPGARLQPAAQTRRAFDPLGNARAQRLDVRSALTVGRVEDHDLQGVARDRRRLQPEDRAILASERLK